MVVSMAHWIVVMCIAVIAQDASSQIPTVCADEVSLQSMTCCPSNCGSAEGRGECIVVDNPPDMTSDDVRFNWPHYFTRACTCSGNYGGYDCSRCKYGYYGENCDMTQVLPRKSIVELSEDEWVDYIAILQATRVYNSEYRVILNESRPGTTNVDPLNITLYRMFVWSHHFATKDMLCDDDCIPVDYAHKATGFPTWHRQFMLWLEWEIQYMLKSMGRENYHTFRLHYWDWINTNRAEVFTADRLGTNENGSPLVVGSLYSNGWDTVCWYNGSGNVTGQIGAICDPRVDTGPLLRCPIVDGINPCTSDENWPTLDDVIEALSRPMYDTPSFDIQATNESFRNRMEGVELGISDEECESNPFCFDGTQIHLHNLVHVLTGSGNLKSDVTIPSFMVGVMSNQLASPNDPLFINHHGMVDCILEEWLLRYPDATYPDVPNELKRHQRDAYIIPFFPLYKHSDVFKTADNFGYSCDISFSRSSAVPLSKPFYWIAFVAVCSLTLLYTY